LLRLLFSIPQTRCGAANTSTTIFSTRGSTTATPTPIPMR
jgi:hypothetical protein